MKILNSNQLPKLDEHVKDLVRDGVYTLYEIQLSAASYLLYTQRRAEHYFLSSTGEILSLDIKPSDIESSSALIVDIVSFAGSASGVRIEIE